MQKAINMPMVIFFFMNFTAIASSYLLAYKFFKLDKFTDSLSLWFVLYLSQIVITELILGVFGVLYLYNIIMLNAAVFLVVLFITRDKKPAIILAPVEILDKLLSDKAILFATSIIIGFGLIKIATNLVNPPFGWDDLNYHFTFPVEWLKHGNLSNPITIFDDPGPSYYPINGSLFFFWLILPLKNVFLADVGQVPFVALGLLALYSLARKIGLAREKAYIAGSLFILIPNYFKQIDVAYVDIMVAALFFSALNYLFLLEREFSLKNAIAYSLSLGLFLGVKTVALPYSALLLLPFLYLSLKNIKKFHFTVFSLLLIIAFGGFGYLRNLIDTGNPLYPLDFSLWGKAIFKGVVDKATYAAHFKPEDYALSKILFHEGLGAQSLVFIIPSVFLALPLAWIRNKKIPAFNLTYFLLLPIFLYLIYRYIIPLANVRYLYALLGVGMVGGVYLTEILNIPGWILKASVSICALASAMELAKRRELIFSLVLTAALFFIIPLVMKAVKKRGVPAKALGWGIFIFLFSALIFLERDYRNNEYPRYVKTIKRSHFWPDAVRAWKWLNDNTKSDNIAYTGRPVAFPLYGTDFKNNVFYVSVNKTDPAKLHYFPDSNYRWGYDFLSLHRNLEAKGNYRWGVDYPAWFNNLSGRQTDYLFVYSLHQIKDIEFPVEDRWAAAHPDKFIPVFTNATIHIYKVIK